MEQPLADIWPYEFLNHVRPTSAANSTAIFDGWRATMMHRLFTSGAGIECVTRRLPRSCSIAPLPVGNARNDPVPGCPVHVRRLSMAWMSRFAGVGLFAMLLVPATAHAHPHVFVTHKATVVFDKGAIAGIEHVWFFDEFYTAMAVEGLDTNKDGAFSRNELHELAKTNIEGLKEFGYFTSATLKGQDIKVGDPPDFWLEHKDGVLSLHFRSPLPAPVPASNVKLTVSVYDPSYFIAFELVEKEPVALGPGAPKACGFAVGVPEAEAEQNKQLSGAFGGQLGGSGLGMGAVKTITVTCSGS
jgi:ABC-type uncharacterized transport system substrate-binding protein